MPNFPLHHKNYLHLLKNYLRYDLSILFYITLIFTAIFYTILNLIHTEIHRNLMLYGGLHEAKTSYMVDLGIDAEAKDLAYLLELLEKYHLLEIKEIWISISPLSNVGIVSSDNPINISGLDGRYFTEQELIDGSNAIILSNEDYRTYYKNYSIGDILSIGNTDFQFIGISYDVGHSVIPLNYLLNTQSSFKMPRVHIRHIILKTEYRINLWARRQIHQKYARQAVSDRQKKTFSFTSNFWHVFIDIWTSMSDYILSIGIVLGLCVLLLFQTCSILYNKNQLHPSIYFLSGGSKYLFKQIILGELITTIIISLFLACFLFMVKMQCIN